jgi:signal transduction histidine kinase
MERILLLLEHQGNRRLLATWLSQHYQVVLAEAPASLSAAFDLAILDAPALEQQRQAVLARKAAEEPVFLPCLLLSPRQQVRQVAHHLWQSVDELLLTPTDQLELHARAEILLRVRRQSLELKRHNDELAAFIDERRAVERMKDEFISIASHELRTPLTSIMGYVSLLLAGEVGALTEEQQSFLQIVDSNAERLIGLVHELLDMSRIESGRIQLTLHPVDLCKVVQAVCTDLRTVSRSKHITTVVQLPLEPIHVQADRDRLIQVLTNLLSNAYKYSPENTTVTIQGMVQDGSAQVNVVDEGMGISESDQAQLFRKFFRADSARRQGIAGTGLGLSITRSLVEMQGGQIWVSSCLGHGSTFSFTLPLAQPSDSLTQHREECA